MAELDAHQTSAALESLMCIDEVARVLRISERGVYRLMRRGELPCLKVGGRTLLEPEEVRRFIAKRRSSEGWEAEQDER